jgi:hypothetical protein
MGSGDRVCKQFQTLLYLSTERRGDERASRSENTPVDPNESERPESEPAAFDAVSGHFSATITTRPAVSYGLL